MNFQIFFKLGSFLVTLVGNSYQCFFANLIILEKINHTWSLSVSIKGGFYSQGTDDYSQGTDDLSPLKLHKLNTSSGK